MEQETACLILNTFDITTNITAATFYNLTVDNNMEP